MRVEAAACFASPCVTVFSSVSHPNPKTFVSAHSPTNLKVSWRPKKAMRLTECRFGYSSYSLRGIGGRMRCQKLVESVEVPSALANSSLLELLGAFKRLSFRYYSLLVGYCNQTIRGYEANINNFMKWQEKFGQNIPVVAFRFVLCVVLVMSLSLNANNSPSWALTEENLLFLEAWRTVDRAYYDKTFNGQSWFRLRENALRNEPMSTREETYKAIRKMLSTLDDPFTRFLGPEEFRSLRSGTQGALTGVGLSIGYPTTLAESTAGLVVMSASPGGPAEKAGIIPGDIILAIDDTSTEDMDIYDAAERLQGPEGSSVTLSIRSGHEIKNKLLRREKVTLNPVKSKFCVVSSSGEDDSRIGYIKLASFNQNASGAVRKAIDTLRNNNVKAFVLDLRNNSGGLFPEGVEIAKIWLEKGVIVYICDSRGVRDIYETDGSNVMAGSEPLAVLVNKGTASASEILAGALKDNKRAVLFGEPTFGKGKIQSVFELSDGSGLAVTVARYETPAHIDIDKAGIVPDHPLPMSFPLDEDGFCTCLKDPASPCSINITTLFPR